MPRLHRLSFSKSSAAHFTRCGAPEPNVAFFFRWQVHGSRRRRSGIWPLRVREALSSHRTSSYRFLGWLCPSCERCPGPATQGTGQQTYTQIHDDVETFFTLLVLWEGKSTSITHKCSTLMFPSILPWQADEQTFELTDFRRHYNNRTISDNIIHITQSKISPLCPVDNLLNTKNTSSQNILLGSPSQTCGLVDKAEYSGRNKSLPHLLVHWLISIRAMSVMRNYGKCNYTYIHVFWKKFIAVWFNPFQAVVLVGWVCAIVVGMSCVFGLLAYTETGKPMDVHLQALYVSLGRTAWALALAWVVMACACGYGGRVFCVSTAALVMTWWSHSR